MLLLRGAQAAVLYLMIVIAVWVLMKADGNSDFGEME